MRDPLWDVDRCDAVVELVVSVLEGRLELTVEHWVGRYIERRFDHIVRVAEAQVQI